VSRAQHPFAPDAGCCFPLLVTRCPHLLSGCFQEKKQRETMTLEALEESSCFDLVEAVKTNGLKEDTRKVAALRHGFVHVDGADLMEAASPSRRRRAKSAEPRPVSEAEELAFARYVATFHFLHSESAPASPTDSPADCKSFMPKTPTTPGNARRALLEFATPVKTFADPGEIEPAPELKLPPAVETKRIPDFPLGVFTTPVKESVPRPVRTASSFNAAAAAFSPTRMSESDRSRLRAEAPSFVPSCPTPPASGGTQWRPLSTVPPSARAGTFEAGARMLVTPPPPSPPPAPVSVAPSIPQGQFRSPAPLHCPGSPCHSVPLGIAFSHFPQTPVAHHLQPTAPYCPTQSAPVSGFLRQPMPSYSPSHSIDLQAFLGPSSVEQLTNESYCEWSRKSLQVEQESMFTPWRNDFQIAQANPQEAAATTPPPSFLDCEPSFKSISRGSSTTAPTSGGDGSNFADAGGDEGQLNFRDRDARCFGSSAALSNGSTFGGSSTSPTFTTASSSLMWQPTMRA